MEVLDISVDPLETKLKAEFKYKRKAFPFCLFVSLRYFNKGRAPLECDKEFWDLRDSVVHCELLILRQLNFHVSFEHPHKV